MGFKVNQKCKAVCPLYEDIIRTSNGSIAGVQCAFLCDSSHFGFSAHTIVRLSNWHETKELKELLCDEMYEGCPYYQAWIAANKKAGV